MITSTHGENKTYLNQVFLLEYNPLGTQEDTEEEFDQNTSNIYEDGSQYRNSRGSKRSKNNFKNGSNHNSEHIQYMGEEDSQRKILSSDQV